MRRHSRTSRRVDPIIVPPLSTIELVMEVEDAFGIEIPGSDAARIHTFGDLKRYVLSRVPTRPASACGTQRSFYPLRGALVRALAVSRWSVHPSTSWGDLLPRWWTRRFLWRRIERELGEPLPGLLTLYEHPAGRAILIAMTALACGVAAVFLALAAAGATSLPLAPSALLAPLALAGAATTAFGLPRYRTTVGATAEYPCARSAPPLPPVAGAWTPEDVVRTIDRLIVEITELEDYPDDAPVQD